MSTFHISTCDVIDTTVMTGQYTDKDLVVAKLKNNDQVETYKKVNVGDKMMTVNGVGVNSTEEFSRLDTSVFGNDCTSPI